MNAHAAFVAGTGLPPAAVPRRTGELRLDERQGRALVDAVGAERITGLAVAALHHGSLVVDPAVAAELESRHERSLALDLRLERLLVETVTTLAGAGVETRALKGPAVAHLDYADPALRSFGDIDLLVGAADYDRAVAVLTRAGGSPHYREPRPGFTARFGKGVCIETGDGFEIDLHRSFVAGPFGISLRTDELFATPARFELGGETILALGSTARFLHACYHAALGGRVPRLSALRDVAELAWNDTVDVDEVRDLARASRAGIVVQHAWALVGAALGAVPPAPMAAWLDTHRPDRFEQRSLQAYTGEHRSYGSQVVAGIRAIPSMRDRAAYVRALAIPDREYVAARGGSYRHRISRAMKLTAASKAARS